MEKTQKSVGSFAFVLNTATHRYLLGKGLLMIENLYVAAGFWEGREPELNGVVSLSEAFSLKGSS